MKIRVSELKKLIREATSSPSAVTQRSAQDTYALGDQMIELARQYWLSTFSNDLMNSPEDPIPEDEAREHWATQVDSACQQLENVIYEALEREDSALNNGEYGF